MLRAGFLAVSLALLPAPAVANIIDVTMTGKAYVLFNIYTPFTTHFTFDTALGTMEITSPGNYQLTGGLLTASIDVVGIITFASNWIPWSPFLTWNDDFSSVHAHVGGILSTYYGFDIDTAIGLGHFQFGQCGAPYPRNLCGVFQSIDSVTVNVPAPVAGTGIPCLILAAGALIGYRRRRLSTSLRRAFAYATAPLRAAQHSDLSRSRR